MLTNGRLACAADALQLRKVDESPELKAAKETILRNRELRRALEAAHDAKADQDK